MEEKVQWACRTIGRVREEISRTVVGQDQALEGVLICLAAGGHALLEGVPGTGKTTLIKSLGNALELRTSRIQFTPDLMPADIVGTNVLILDEEERRGAPPGERRIVRFQQGPVFANIILADEINRATPKTQSALLEAMQERTVTAGGSTYVLEAPFIVLATQNPIEMEGTYPLPEAQLDRFFLKLTLDYPSPAELAAIIQRTTGGEEPRTRPAADGETVRALSALVREVPAAAHVTDYAIRLAQATRPGAPGCTELAARYVRYGASPRGPQSLVLAAKARALFDGRMAASFADVRAVCMPCLRHRVLLNFEGEAEGVGAERIIEDALARVPETPEGKAR
jgi:MoxR-like ATPase